MSTIKGATSARGLSLLMTSYLRARILPVSSLCELAAGVGKGKLSHAS
uniref:Uncharacterized protein n=1 Tax=Anguilla anguilla TaxID=7936 RepID=A0A0E9UH31_ANGAN